MKTKVALQDWYLIQQSPVSERLAQLHTLPDAEKVFIGQPVTAMEALIQTGKISGSILEDGEAAYCEWVAEQDWLYTCTFLRPLTKGPVFLFFGGLDADCDVFLNSKKVADHHTVYLPLRIDVTSLLTEENRLSVYFYSPVRLYHTYEETMPQAWKGIVDPVALIRKPPNDFFRNYLGVTPYFTPVGIFEDIVLELVDEAEIIETNCTIDVNPSLTSAAIEMSAVVTADNPAIEVAFTLLGPSGEQVFTKRVAVVDTADNSSTMRASFTLDHPHLWWPIGYGEQSLYMAYYSLYSGGRKLDESQRQIGIRLVETVGSLKFRINGVVIRMWGGNISTVGNISHRWNPEKGTELLQKSTLCNCNTLRIWGAGDLLGDSFYDEADRLGIMLWQDFPIEPSQLPDTAEYMALFAAEAEHLVRRLRTHPSVILWCGGNESFHMRDFRPETGRVGLEHLMEDVYPEICARLDPSRLYHLSCPIGGAYPNDPLFGDTHGSRCMMSYLPGTEFANFVSEDIFTTPPEFKSLVRFIPEDKIWPKGYNDKATFGRASLLPPALARRTAGGLTSEMKTGPLEQFYDATDAQSLVYKYAAAAGYGYYKNIATLRRGKPAHDSAGERRSNGHLVWKFNNTWPQFYCGLVDYYGQCHIPYYSVRRAFEPFLITFEVQDHIYLWGVNDTPNDMAGFLTVKVFDLDKGEVVKERSCPACVLSGQSTICTNLDDFRYFRKNCILYASFAVDGVEKARAVGTVDMERHLTFPKAKLTLQIKETELIIKTDRFARCVELSAVSEEGDAFGWHFEDNYFDQFPFETKTVKLIRQHKTGVITAKAHYSDHSASIDWRADY